MPLAPGTTLGPYEIVAPLGAGGMGEVYRARDARLGRDVAIKVLPQHLSSQPEVRARFEREAKMVSSLAHPNICVLYDVGREGETDFLVMELIEGGTLAERLKRGALPAAELLRLGTQIADALDRAHRAGVIHRDLKPGNIMLTRSGAKLMDFGLSRATGLAGSASGSGQTTTPLSQSPTIAQALTAEGTLLGTFQYMSPEQLEGGEADARSDIWALGCVLYEMATGRRAFEGRSQASLIAAILEREPPPVAEAPSGSGQSSFGGPPHGLDRLIRNCLAKDPEERIQTAHDIKLQLQGIAEGAGVPATSTMTSQIGPAPVTAARAAASSRIAWGVATAAVIVAIGVFAWLFPRANVRPQPFRFEVESLPGMIDTSWPRISPDGRYLVMLGQDSSTVLRAYVRRMDQLEANPIPGTEGLTRPYWSPDSREIAFIADGRMQRVPIAGGSPTVICAATGSDLSWGTKGLILMDGRVTDTLMVVPASGGELRPATRVHREDGEIGSGWPCFLPDGEHFLYIGNLAGTDLAGNIRLGRIGSLDSKRIGQSDGRVEYAPGGWVLFVRGNALMAQKLDLGAGKLTGQPITLGDDLRTGPSEGHFSASQAGPIAIAHQNRLTSILREVDRRGTPVGPPLARGHIVNPRISPDGRRLLYQSVNAASGFGGDVHVVDLARGTDTPLTFTGGLASTPVWSPDSRRFAFVQRGDSTAHAIVGPADGLGRRDSIDLQARAPSLSQWTSGDRLAYNTENFFGRIVPVDGPDHTIRLLLEAQPRLAQPAISPDGRWLAYAAGTSAADVSVYVASLEGPPGRWQISTQPSVQPRWTRGGREIVYPTLNWTLMSAEVDTRDGFHAGTPRPLFSMPQSPFAWSWDVDASGQRFFVLFPDDARQSPATIEVITDFGSLVNRR